MGLAAFAERAIVAERSLVRIPQDVPLDIACLFGCPVLCGAGTVLHTSGVELGHSVAVIGLGGIGLTAVMGAVIAGARTIIAVDASAKRRQIAGTLGATALVDPTTANPAEAIRALTGGGADHVIEAAGVEDAFEAAFLATRRGGTTVTLGLPSPAARFPLPLGQLVGEARTIRGSYLGSCVPSRDIPAFLALYQQGRMPVDRLITDRIRLEDLNDAFDRFREGAAIRQVVLL
jgi:alcohol dehydrogenase